MPARYPDRRPQRSAHPRVGPVPCPFPGSPRRQGVACRRPAGWTPRRPPRAARPERPLRAWQRSALARYLAAAPQDFLAVATPGRRQDDLRPAGGRRAARRPGDRRDHRGDPDRAPQAAVVAGRRAGRGGHRPGLPQLDRRHLLGLHRHRGHLRRRRRAPAAAPGPHREPAHPGRPGRDPPRRGRPQLGGRGQGGVRAGRPPARPDRHPVPQRRQPDPVRRLPARRRRRAAQPGRPLLRLRRGAGRRGGPAGGVPGLLGRCPAGAPAPARRSPPGSASR